MGFRCTPALGRAEAERKEGRRGDGTAPRQRARREEALASRRKRTLLKLELEAATIARDVHSRAPGQWTPASVGLLPPKPRALPAGGARPAHSLARPRRVWYQHRLCQLLVAHVRRQKHCGHADLDGDTTTLCGSHGKEKGARVEIAERRVTASVATAVRSDAREK